MQCENAPRLQQEALSVLLIVLRNPNSISRAPSSARFSGYDPHEQNHRSYSKPLPLDRHSLGGPYKPFSASGPSQRFVNIPVKSTPAGTGIFHCYPFNWHLPCLRARGLGPFWLSTPERLTFIFITLLLLQRGTF